jgi:hypothetical protein
MQYAMLIYADEATEPKPGTKEFDDYMASYFSLSDTVKKNGMFQAGSALQPVATATTVRVRDGRVATTDGPFAETKEQLGGLYVLECKDLDEALEYAAKIPTANHGSIEVRPIMNFEEE